MEPNINLTINDRALTVPAGTTLLQAARKVGVEIPALCHLDGFHPYTSCMICVVWDEASRRMIPSCSARVGEGMVIRTDTEAVREARRSVLDLLLSEHVGDCEAPCRLACPAYMDIPAMIRCIRAGELEAAARIVKTHIPLSGVLGRICPAPCEKACRRAAIDDPVAICLLKRFVADTDLATANPWLPRPGPSTGPRVAVIGAGPAGLSAAWFLRWSGVQCTVYEQEQKPGGALRSAVGRDLLPAAVLDAEIEQIDRLEITWRTGVALGRDLSLATLQAEHDAVILALGPCAEAGTRALGLPVGSKGIDVDRKTLAVNADGLFAAGSCVRPTRMAVRAVADGHTASASVLRWLGLSPATDMHRRFNSRMPKVSAEELQTFLQEADSAGRRNVEPGNGLTSDAAVREATRCLRCDCRDKEACVLRALSETYDARQHRLPIDERPPFAKTFYSEGTVLETGKCIKCGKCVRICEAAGVTGGLAFLGRGLDVQVGVPFDGDLADIPAETVRACIDACPTGALARAKSAIS